MLRSPDPDIKRHNLLRVVRQTEGVGIVFVATVKLADELYGWLQARGEKVGRYHGKMHTRD